MTIHTDRFVKGMRFTQEFILDDAADQVIPKITPGSVVGNAIAAATPDAADTVKGLTSLAVAANFPSVSDAEATTPAFVNAAVLDAIAAVPVAADTTAGLVALNQGTDLPEDVDNSTDALTSHGAIAILQDSTVSGGNALQQAVLDAVEKTIAADASAQNVVATAIVDDIHTQFPVAGDGVQGKVGLTTAAHFPDDTNDVDATTPAYVAAAIAALPTAGDTVKGVVALNRGTDMPGDATNNVDALTTAGINAINSDIVTPGGNPAQAAVVVAVQRALASNLVAQDVIATALVDDILSKFPVAADTVQGKVSLAVASNFPSNSNTEAVTPAYLDAAVASLVPDATDTVKGRIALNLGTNMPNDGFNSTDALTAAGFNSIANSSVSTPNSLQQAVVNAVEKGIANDAGAKEAIAVALVSDVHEVFPVAEDTVQGKVALNTGSALPADATNTTDALTAVGLSNIMDSTATTGGNAVQRSVVAAVGKALESDTGVQSVMGDLLKDDLSTAITAHAPSMQKFVTAFPDADDTVKGKVSLAVAANFPSSSNIEATTPAYVNAAISASNAPATDTTSGTVQLNLGTNLPGDSTNTSDALTASGVKNLLTDNVAGGNVVQKGVVTAFEKALGSDTTSQASIANTLADDLITNFAGSTSFEALIKDLETPSTMTLVGGKYVHTNEDNVSTQIDPANFRSPDAGNALSLDANGLLKVLIPAQLPDDQVFTGDSTGTVGLVMTPLEDVATGNTNYTIKADLKVAVNTPSAVANSLKWSASGFYVDTATDTIKGAVALNTGSDLTGDPTNNLDALTAVGVSNILNDNTPANGNAVQQAIVNAVKQSLPSNTVAQQVIADAIIDEVLALLPAATDTVQGKVSLAIEANAPSTSDTEATTPAYVGKVVADAITAGAVPVATDAVQGKVALNLGTSLPGDATNSTDALTASGLNTILSDSGGNAAKTAVTAAVTAASTTAAGKVQLTNTAPSTSSTTAATPAFVNAAVTAAATPVATDTVQGKVSLAVAANHPSVSNTEAATPAYVTAAVAAAISSMVDVFGL